MLYHWYCRPHFQERYASDALPDGNPFCECTDFDATAWTWKRRLQFTSNSKDECEVLCNPEDVRRTAKCKHPQEVLCKFCEIPLCHECYKHCKAPHVGIIPMGLGNDNFWGYTSGILYKHQVRWIEAAIVLPCWTSIMVYYVEGDGGHLMTETVGTQRFRTVVRGSCVCKAHGNLMCQAIFKIIQTCAQFWGLLKDVEPKPPLYVL